ncbi:uncharacterized protein DDB_G0283357-like [Argonauta hians]
MAVNASESLQAHRELTGLEGTTDTAGGGSDSVYNDLEEFEKSIHNSFNMLMEYRDAPPSPSTSSVTSVSASGLDALSSPTTPASPVPEEMDDERLPNELLEEICEDMGIKDSMDIDLIDYMMDQTSQMNSTQTNENYCNSVDISHPMHRTSDVGMRIKSPVMPNLSMPIGKDNVQHVNSPHYSLMNNGSPSMPRHMSGKPMYHSKSSQSYVGKSVSTPSHMQSEQGFKAPCAPTQLATSVPSNSTSKHNNYHPISQGQPQTPPTNCMHSSSYMSSSVTHSCCGGSHQHHPHCSTPSSRENSNHHPRTVTFAEGPPKIMNHNLASSKYNMASMGNNNDGGHHYNTNNNNSNCSQPPMHGNVPPGKSDMYRQHNSAYSLQPQNKYGRPSPPVVNVQNMQHHMKMSNNHHNFNNTAKLSHADCLHQQPMRPMPNCTFKYEDQQLAALHKGNNGRTLESPLDQGYFSGDAASVKSYSSQSSVCQSNDMLSSQDSLTIKTEPSQHHHPQQMMFNRSDMAGQAMVKTENNMMQASGPMNQNQREHISNMKQYTSQQQANAFSPCNKQTMHQGCVQQYGYNMPANMSTCTSDPSQKSVQSKILPRLNHSKDVAPYTVPSNNGQATINPYHEFSQGVPTSDQSGLDNANAGVDFPTNFGKESLNSEHNQISCQRVNNYGNSDYPGQSNGSCIMNNSEFSSSNSHSSNIPPQPSPNTSYNNYRSQSNEMGQAMQQTMAHSGPAYQSACLPKGLETNQHVPHNSEHARGYPGISPNQLGPVMKPFKQDPDNQFYNAQKQSYMHDAHLASQNQLPAQSWSQQQQMQQQQGYPPVNMNNSVQMHPPNSRYMCPRNTVRPPSQCIQTPVPPHSISNPNMPHNMEIRNRVGMDLPSNHLGSHPHPNMINGNMPPQTCPQGNWSVDMGRGANINHQVPQPVQMIPQAKIPNAGLQHMQFPPQSGDPNCQMGVPNNCKFSHRPPMLSSQEAFIEHLIMDKSSAYRSHPLFPLLRDLMITYMNFNSQSIHYQLIQHLPSQFERLLQNFLNRNPPRGDYQSNYAVESVIMDALRYAHSSLIQKIRSKQEQDKRIKGASQSITAIEEFCEKFDRSKHNASMDPGICIHGNSASNVRPCGNQVFCRNAFLTDPTKGAHLPLEVLKEQPDSMSDTGSVVSSSSNHSAKSESKKHPSLPKEAVAIMLEWLRNHKDNPYPNDDEKAMLIKQTGLTINQINYWFTNARRRILPKWAQAQAQAQAQARSSTPTNTQHSVQTGQQQQHQPQTDLMSTTAKQQPPDSPVISSSTFIGSSVGGAGSNYSSCSNNNNNNNNSSSNNLNIITTSTTTMNNNNSNTNSIGSCTISSSSNSSNNNNNNNISNNCNNDITTSPHLSPSSPSSSSSSSQHHQLPTQSSSNIISNHNSTSPSTSSARQSPISRISEHLCEASEPQSSSSARSSLTLKH